MDKLEGTPTQGLIGATPGFLLGFAAVSLFRPTAHQFGPAPVTLATRMRAFQKRYGLFPTEESK